jgi:Mitochondrial ribosomal protein L28
MLPRAIRRFASAAQKTLPKKSVTQDWRSVLIKKMIYDNPASRTPTPAVSLRESPVYVGEDADTLMAEELERAYCVHLQLEKEAHIKRIREGYTSMRLAMEQLEKVDKRLFEGTMVQLKEHELFPKRMRVPTETPPLNGWDYEMDRNK